VTAVQPTTGPRLPDPPPTQQRVVGGYRLAELIGRGSIGDVHLATEPITGRQVALKLLRPVTDTNGEERAQARRRFLAEAETARQLDHPDIVHVLAAGDDAGTAWMAMELLGGCNLERYTRQARLLPEPVVLRLAERIARALAYAHSRGVVHRDVKPANVIVDWTSGRVTLTDFGLARAAGAESTRTGLVLGTPVYMSPEQLAGAPADARGDLYALGVMLFQLLTGRLPHESHSLGDLLRQVAHDTAPDLRQIRPELPAALAALVAALLAKAPGARTRDGLVVADSLAALVSQAAAAGPMSRG
jgi:eukaryotic-like serine/threonine-protein kinase